MNMAARTFRSLITTLRTSPESYQADTLCQELYGWLVATPAHHALVAFIYKHNIDTYRWFEGTLVFLQKNNITLSQRPHLTYKGWFIFAELHTSQSAQPYLFDIPVLELAA